MRQEVVGRYVSPRQIEFLTFAINQRDSGANVFTRHRSFSRVNHRDAGQTREFVGLARNRDALIHRTELHRTRYFGDDRVCVWIPSRNNITRRNRGFVLHPNCGAIRHLISLSLSAHRV